MRDIIPKTAVQKNFSEKSMVSPENALETSLKWLTVAMPFLKIRERLARD